MNGLDFVIIGQSLHLKVDAQLARSDLTADKLQEAFNSSGCERCVVDDSTFQTVLNTIKASNNDLFHIGHCRDAALTLAISDDAMEVTARACASSGGRPLSMKNLFHLLRDQGVTTGIRRSSLETLIEHSEQGPPGEIMELVIARGRPAVDGDPATFKPLSQDARERVLQPQTVDNDSDRVDMRNLGDIISVEPGTPLLEKIPLTVGLNGFNVRGETIDPVPGCDRDLHAGEGTTFSDDNPLILVATRRGLPRMVDNTAYVDDVLTMRKVDATTGHVVYDGSVLINGNVGPGMKVTAGGDITVSGYVDSASLHAKGNVTVTKGVIGQQHNIDESDDEEQQDAPVEHSAHITAGGSIWVSYSQYSTLKSDHGIIVDKQLTHCHVVTGGSVCLGGEGREARGKLIGGVIETSTHVYAGQIGAPAGTRTIIQIATPQATPEYLARQNTLADELRHELAQLKKCTRIQQRALEEPESDKRHAFLMSLAQTMENHRRNITVIRIHVQELSKQAPERQIISVHANRVLYSGCIFRSDYETKRIDENRGPSTLQLKNGTFSYQYVG